MERDWTKNDWVSATRNYIEHQIRDGYSSEPIMKSKTSPATKSNTKPDSPITIFSNDLTEIRSVIGDCTRCPLHKGRNKIVYGVGNPKADLVIVGEAPGRDEDAQGEPFVGRAGKLLTDILAAIGLSRDDVYICNVVKCRPPQNRPPEPLEIETCSPFLEAQINSIQPKFLCTLGKFATQTLLRIETPISQLRGNFQKYKNIPLMPTYHPAYLLRNPAAKKEVWEDMKKLHAELCKTTGKNLPLKGKA